MMRCMCGLTRWDRVRNEVLRDKVAVTPLENKMRDGRFRWFGHVKGRSLDATVRKCEMIILPQGRRGRSKVTKKELERGD